MIRLLQSNVQRISANIISASACPWTLLQSYQATQLGHPSMGRHTVYEAILFPMLAR